MASKLRILLAALLLLSAPLASGAQAKTEVRLAVLAPSALLWPHAIAREEGFYADADIEVKELIAGSSPALLQAVSSGSVEAGISLGDLVIRAIDQGAPIAITSAVNRTAAVEALAAYTSVVADVCADSYKFLIEDQQALGRGLAVQTAGLENILMIDRALGETPATVRHFDLARYYDPGFLVGK